MLALLPALAVLSVCFALANAFPDWGWRRSFLRSLVALGAYMMLTSEGLSLVAGITRAGLIAVWMVPTLVSAGWLLVRIGLKTPIRLPGWGRPSGAFDWVLLGCGLAILLTTALVAWVSPPNTWDSLTYHMARVAHWAQERSLASFATGNERQNFMSPAAETGMLQLYVLAGGDRTVNLVEWFAMLGSVVGVTWIAKDLGASRLGQIFAALFVLTLPMGIAQASSTMTDYVVALWMVCVAAETVRLFRRASPVGFAFLAFGAGLAINTKPTALAYLLPFAVAVMVVMIRRYRFNRMLALSAMTLAIVVIINAGYMSRNMSLYGNPLGSSSRISAHENRVLDWRVFVSNVLRNASLHAGTPNLYINKGIAIVVVKIHQLIGLDPTDPRTSAHLIFRVRPPSLNEAKAGNLGQAVLILVAVFLVIWKRTDFDPLVLGFTSIVIATFLVLSLTLKYSVFGSRYQLPFFVLFAPAAGIIFSSRLPPLVVRLIALCLCAICVPWLINLDPRPLISPAGTNGRSIMTRPRDSLYFALDPSVEEPYSDMVSAVNDAGCSAVGIMLSGGAAEYPLWVLLGAPRSDLTVEAIVAGTASARLSDDSFEPCAVVCDSSCSREQTRIRGLTKVYDTAGYRLYMREEASP